MYKFIAFKDLKTLYSPPLLCSVLVLPSSYWILAREHVVINLKYVVNMSTLFRRNFLHLYWRNSQLPVYLLTTSPPIVESPGGQLKVNSKGWKLMHMILQLLLYYWEVKMASLPFINRLQIQARTKENCPLHEHNVAPPAHENGYWPACREPHGCRSAVNAAALKGNREDPRLSLLVV